MDNKEIFIKTYNTHVKFTLYCEALEDMGIFLEDSPLVECFFELFESQMSNILTETGDQLLYEQFLYKDFTAEEILEELKEYLL